MAQTTSIKHKGWKWSTADESNPTLVMVLDNTSKAVHITDAADASTDWAVSADSHPSVYIHSATNPDSNYIKMYHDGTVGRIELEGSSNYIAGNPADQILIVAADIIKLHAGTFIDVEDNMRAKGNITLNFGTTNKKLFLRGTTNYIYADPADQVHVVSAGMIKLTPGTYVQVEGELKTKGHISLNIWTTNDKIYLKGTTNYIYADAADQVNIVAAASIKLTPGTYVNCENDLKIKGDVYMNFGVTNKKVYLRGTTNYIWGNEADQVVIVAACAGGAILLNPSSDPNGYISCGSCIRLANLASGLAVTGATWFDTSDNKIHYYNGSSEKTLSPD